MIHYITKNNVAVKEVEDELTIGNTLTPEDVGWLNSLDAIGIDLETNSLDPFLGSILLVIIGNKERQYVINVTDTSLFINIAELIDKLDKQKKLWLGANSKFDYKFIKVKFNVSLNRMFDVMIAEQRIMQGITIPDPTNRFGRSPISSALNKIVQRKLGFIPPAMDKTIRDSFINANPNTFIFQNLHIYYAANDIKYLFDIREKQKEEIQRYNLNFLIYNIEFPLIRILADCELNGEDIDEKKWKDNIKRNKDLKFEIECKLDEEFRNLRNAIVEEEELKYLSGGKYDRQRQKEQEIQQDNLFGDAFNEIEINPLGKKSKTKSKFKEPYINYSSTTEIINIFGRLKQPAPTKEDGIYIVPSFVMKKGKQKVDSSYYGFTTSAKAIEAYNIENPKSIMKNFVTNLIKYRTYVTRLSTFGEDFLIKYKNPITKRFHTIYRQCDAVTGRLQSGDKNNGWYNSQNIPREKEYREPFHYKDYDIITTDLSGAEAVIMIDKARDEKFYEMAIVNDDAHSPLAQAVWRAIGEHRVQESMNSFDESIKYEEAIKLSQIVISKKENKDIRTAYKPMTFGDIYGMGIKKRMKTLGISEEEAKIAGTVQKNMIPKTYKMVEANAKFASTYGYVILNTRTNSRMWFSEVFEARKNNSQLDSMVKHTIESSARNAPIQGTQADMVKEIMVEIHKEAVRQNLYREEIDLKLLKQVHDETVYGVKPGMADFIVEFIPEQKQSTVVTGKGINVEQVLHVEYVPIKDFIKKMHTKVCNRYLSFITMGAEQNVGKSWTK